MKMKSVREWYLPIGGLISISCLWISAVAWEGYIGYGEPHALSPRVTSIGMRDGRIYIQRSTYKPVPAITVRPRMIFSFRASESGITLPRVLPGPDLTSGPSSFSVRVPVWILMVLWIVLGGAWIWTRAHNRPNKSR